MDSQIKVLMAKIGSDGHDRGVRIVTRGLIDSGMEVVYTGPWLTVEQVIEISMEEDVDVIGISTLAYDHPEIPKMMEKLRNLDAEDIVVIVGGIIPQDDVKVLEDSGVSKVFHPGTKIDDIILFIEIEVEKKRKMRE